MQTTDILEAFAPCVYFYPVGMSELKTRLNRLGLTPSELARRMGVSPESVNQWLARKSVLPSEVTEYLRQLEAVERNILAANIAQHGARNAAFDEGVYSLSYRSEHDEVAGESDALAVLRAGCILGSDRWGGVFSGTYHYDQAKRVNTFEVRISVPPGGELITGYSAGEKGSKIYIVAEFKRPDPVATATIEIAGQHIELYLRYLGPPPN